MSTNHEQIEQHRRYGHGDNDDATLGQHGAAVQVNDHLCARLKWHDRTTHEGNSTLLIWHVQLVATTPRRSDGFGET